jgi:hypothetical protein
MPTDLSSLSEELQSQAVQIPSGEVMWPRTVAARAVAALADDGQVILGLDLRSDGDGLTPAGLSTEVPWSSFRPDGSAMDAQVERARQFALDALRRPDLADFDGYGWVLITWTTP